MLSTLRTRGFSSLAKASNAAAVAGTPIRVVAEDRGGELAAITVSVSAGSRNEEQLGGTVHWLHRLAFKSTESRSIVRFVSEAAKKGHNFSSVVSREHLSYQGQGLRSEAEHLFELLSDAVVNPTLSEREIRETRDQVVQDVLALQHNPSLVVREAAHSVAFRSGLGRPLFCPEVNVDAITHDHLEQFRRDNLNTPHLVVSGVNVSAEDLAGWTAKHLGNVQSVDTHGARPSSKYAGGVQAISTPDSSTHVILAHEGPSAASADSAAASVLQALLDVKRGGSNPHSLLRSVQPCCAAGIFDASSFNASYSDSGLFGVYLHVDGNKTHDAVAKVQEAFAKAAQGGFDAEALNAAKHKAIFNILSSVESGVERAEFNAAQLRLVSSGSQLASLAQIADKVNAVTAEDVKKVAARIFATSPTFVAYGSQQSVPSFDVLVNRISA